jgi:6-phosphogluconate dehydrogenase
MLQAMTAIAISIAVIALLAAKYYLNRWTEAEENALLIQHDRDFWKHKADHYENRTRELVQEKEELINKMYENMVHLHAEPNPTPCPEFPLKTTK